MGFVDDKLQQLQEGLTKTIDYVIDCDPAKIHFAVDRLRSTCPGISDKDLAKKIVKRESLKNGLLGFGTGLPGALAMPVTIPGDLIASWRIQATMAYSIAYVFGYTHDNADLKTDIYIIMAGDAGGEVLRQAGLAAGKQIAKKVIEKIAAKQGGQQAMRAFVPIVSKQIAVNAGKQFAKRGASKWIPLIGGPVGFLFSWGQAQAVGRFAVKYYSGEL